MTESLEHAPGLSSKTTMEIIKIALKPGALDTSGVVEQKGIMKHEFVWAKGLENDDVHILHEKVFTGTKNILGAGTFGIARLAGKKDVVKVAKKLEQAEKDVLREAVILKKLNDGYTGPGIMKTPKAVFQIAIAGGKRIFGYLTPRFQCDGAGAGDGKNPPLTRGNILSGFGQLFAGVSHMHSKGIYHGDIKLENMSTEKNGAVWNHIDFGGVIDLSEIHTPEDLKAAYAKQGSGSYSPHVVSAWNLYEAQQAGLAGDIPSFKIAMEKRDNLATGMAFLFKVMGNGNVNMMFERNDYGITKLKLSKDEFVQQLTQRGYSANLAVNMYHLIASSVLPSDQTQGLLPAQARRNVEDALRNDLQIERSRPGASQQPAVNRLFNNKQELANLMASGDSESQILQNLTSYKVGSYLVGRSPNGPEPFCIYKNEKNQAGEIVQVRYNFSLAANGDLVLQNGNKYHDLRALSQENFLALIQ